jgi:hypothetical protein
MVQRSRPHGHDVAPVVALCKDPIRGTREIALEPGAHGILLTVCGDYTSRRSSDGRWPVDNVTHYFDVAVHQVRAASAGSSVSNFHSGPRAPRLMETEDLSILAGWAQALAETIADAPEHLDALLASIRAGAPWRVAVQIPEPSNQLCDAIAFFGQLIRAVTRPGDVPKFDDVLASCQEDPPDASRLQTLARRVLRSTLDQLRARRAKEASRTG